MEGEKIRDVPTQPTERIPADKPEESFDEARFLRSLQDLSDFPQKTIKERENRGDYEFFPRGMEREELFEYCKKIADYLYKEEIRNFVVIDRSSRPVYIGVREYWRYKYPDQKSPNVYFINPSGFKSKLEVGKDRKVHLPKESLKTPEEISEEFQKVYKELLKDKDKPVLVFDSCIHSGNTLFPIKRAMEHGGFKNIRIGSVEQNSRGSSVETDFYIADASPYKGCYPFDRDYMIEKVPTSLHSKRSEDEYDIARSMRLRKEIQQIMQDKIKEERDFAQGA